jgi:hypothetical protein
MYLLLSLNLSCKTYHIHLFYTTFLSILDDQPHRIPQERTSDDHDPEM